MSDLVLRMLAVNGTKWADLPSDGVPHVITSDTNAPAEGPCSCIDCRCEKQVEAIMALEAEMMLTPPGRPFRRRTR